MTAPGREVEPDFEAFCACLNRRRVEYVIVGSEAVAVHGAPRYSQDFDAFVRATRENASRILAALEEFGFGEPVRQLDEDRWTRSFGAGVDGLGTSRHTHEGITSQGPWFQLATPCDQRQILQHGGRSTDRIVGEEALPPHRVEDREDRGERIHSR